MEENQKELKIKKSYPALLVDVRVSHDDIRDVYTVEFVYRVYQSLQQTQEVVDVLYWWDLPSYRKFIMRNINKLGEVYNLNLISKDCRNEISLANAFKWLIGTRVEILPYRYGNIRYKVASTERNNIERINFLWKCLSINNLDITSEILLEDWK